MNVVDEKGNEIPKQDSKRIIAGILGIILGELGIHKFILGYTKEGLIGKIEGIIYLTKSDDEFIREYQVNKKAWF